MGLDDAVLSEIHKRQSQKDTGGPPTRLYQTVSVIKAFHLTVSQWAGTSRFDKKCLHYHMVMEAHYMDKSREEMKRKSEAEAKKRELMRKMPAQVSVRGLRR